jgi:predicted transcriptional regulator with HTH domain
VLTQGDILPYVLTIPPASLANVKAYFLGLLRKQQTPDSVVTRIGLTKVENKQKIKYSKVTFERGGNLSPEARQMVKAYAASMAPAFARSVRVDREDVDE